MSPETLKLHNPYLPFLTMPVIPRRVMPEKIDPNKFAEYFGDAQRGKNLSNMLWNASVPVEASGADKSHMIVAVKQIGANTGLIVNQGDLWLTSYPIIGLLKKENGLVDPIALKRIEADDYPGIDEVINAIENRLTDQGVIDDRLSRVPHVVLIRKLKLDVDPKKVLD